MVCALLLAAASTGDVVVLRDGSVVRGTVSSQDGSGLVLRADDGTDSRHAWSDLEPNAAYLLRSRWVDPQTADDHIALGDFCVVLGLSVTAVREYESARALDASRAAEIDAKIAAAQQADMTVRLDRARRAIEERRWDDAARDLRAVLQSAPGTPAADEAARLLTQVTDAVRAEVEERRRALDGGAAPDDRRGRLREAAAEAVSQAGEAWREGLDRESAGDTMGADETWSRAADRLDRTRETLAQMADDGELGEEARRAIGEVDVWLVRLYNSLGQMHIGERDEREALRWINEALKVAPDDPTANHLKMLLTEWRIHR